MFAMPIDPSGSCEEGSVGDGRWADSNLFEMPGSLILHKFVFGTCFWRWLGHTSEVASFSFL